MLQEESEEEVDVSGRGKRKGRSRVSYTEALTDAAFDRLLDAEDEDSDEEIVTGRRPAAKRPRAQQVSSLLGLPDWHAWLTLIYAIHLERCEQDSKVSKVPKGPSATLL